MDKLKCLSNSKLQKLYIDENPLTTSNENYKKELFELIPSLTAIDGKDKNNQEVVSTQYDEEGEEYEDDEEGEDGEDYDDLEGEEVEDDEEEGEDEEDDEGDDEEGSEKQNKKQKK